MYKEDNVMAIHNVYTWIEMFNCGRTSTHFSKVFTSEFTICKKASLLASELASKPFVFEWASLQAVKSYKTLITVVITVKSNGE